MNKKDPIGFKEFYEKKVAELVRDGQGYAYASNATVRQLFKAEMLQLFEERDKDILAMKLAGKRAVRGLHRRKRLRKKPLLCI